MQPNELTTEDRPALLLVDDNEMVRATLGYFFEKHGFHVAIAASLGEAKTLFEGRGGWGAVVSDYHLPDGNGVEFFRWLRERPDSGTPFLLISGAVKEGSFPGVEFLAKPFGFAQLEARVRALLRNEEAGFLRPS